MPNLAGLVQELPGKSMGFRSLQNGAIDATMVSGEWMFSIFSSLAGFERRHIQEPSRAGVPADRAQGPGGRKPIGTDDPRVVTAKRLHRDRGLGIDQISGALGISRPRFYQYLGLPDGTARNLAEQL